MQIIICNIRVPALTSTRAARIDRAIQPGDTMWSWWHVHTPFVRTIVQHWGALARWNQREWERERGRKRSKNRTNSNRIESNADRNALTKNENVGKVKSNNYRHSTCAEYLYHLITFGKVNKNGIHQRIVRLYCFFIIQLRHIFSCDEFDVWGKAEALRACVLIRVYGFWGWGLGWLCRCVTFQLS